MVSFAGGLPAPELFDGDGLRTSYDRVLSRSATRVLQYSTTDGDPALRAAIAERLTARRLPTGPDDLLITSGAQQALWILSMVLLEPGDVVAVENPTYLAALQCFQHLGARIVAVETDEHGVVTEALADVVAAHRPKLLYLVPNFQNPTGHSLPIERRRKIARLAATQGFWIVEDDPYGELRFHGSALPWIRSEASASDRIVLVGSLSKIIAPGLRLGWLHAPAAIRDLCAQVKQSIDIHTSSVDQAAVAEYLATHDLDAHLDLVRAEYRRRCDALLGGLPDALPPGSRWNTPEGGMFVWAHLPEGYDAAAMLPRAVENGVTYVPGAPFFAADPDPRTIRLSFTTHDPAMITEGLSRLASVLRAHE
jgi:2-aminoadipate transaminase